MSNLNLVLIPILTSVSIFLSSGRLLAQQQETPPLVTTVTRTFKLQTDPIIHKTYTQIHTMNYRQLEKNLKDLFTDHCQISLSAQVITEIKPSLSSLFKKGQYVGAFEAKCVDTTIQNIELYFEVFPHDEESNSRLIVTYFNGKKDIFYSCWKDYSPEVNMQKCSNPYASQYFKDIANNFHAK